MPRKSNKKKASRSAVQVTAFALFGFFLVYAGGVSLSKAKSTGGLGSFFNRGGEPLIVCDAIKDVSAVKSDGRQVGEQIKLLNNNLVAVFRAFNSDTAKNKNIDSLKQALIERKQAVMKEFASNPSVFLTSRLPKEERNQIASISENCIEEDKTIEGTWEAYIDESIDGSALKSSKHYFVSTGGRTRVEVMPLFESAAMPTISGSQVKIAGAAMDDRVVFSGFIPSGEYQGVIIGGSGNTGPTLGEQKVVVMMVNFSNTPVPLVTRSQIEQYVFTETANYYQANSYSQASISGDVLAGPQNDWYQINMPQTCDYNAALLEAVALADPNVDFSGYDYINIVAPFNVSTCGWAGIATLGKTSISTGEGIRTMGISFVAASYAGGMHVFAHELGHNFGSQHASFYDCDDVSIADSGCSIVEYGDNFSIMGNLYRGGYFNGLHKDISGWLSAGKMTQVTSDGVYDLEPMGALTGGLKVLKIPRKLNDYLYVEFRQPIGNDAGIGAGSNVFNGVILHTVYSQNNSKSLLLDTSPPGESSNVALLPGQTFTDPASQTQVKLISANPEFARVEVIMGQTDFIPPTVALVSPTPNQEVVNGSVFKATVTDSSGVDFVEFRRLGSPGENTILATDNSYPYEAAVNFPSEGSYLVYARAVDLAGNEGYSEFTSITVISPPNPVTCGDVNNDGTVDISDSVYIMDYIFSGGPAPSPITAGDIDGDGLVTISDVVYLMDYIFQGGPAPVCS